MTAAVDVEKISAYGADQIEALDSEESTSNHGLPPARIAQAEELPSNYYTSKLFLGSYAVGSPVKLNLVHVLTSSGYLRQCDRGYCGFCNDFSTSEHNQHTAGSRSKCCVGWVHVYAGMHSSIQVLDAAY